MDELFQHVEDRVRSLVQKHRDLKKINAELSQSAQQLAQDKERLLLKHKSVAVLVESTIARLKSIEGLS